MVNGGSGSGSGGYRFYYSARVLRAKFLRPTRGMCTVPTWDHRDGFLLKNTTCYGGPLLGCRDAGKKS
jgi:hypothetical protein